MDSKAKYAMKGPQLAALLKEQSRMREASYEAWLTERCICDTDILKPVTTPLKALWESWKEYAESKDLLQYFPHQKFLYNKLRCDKRFYPGHKTDTLMCIRVKTAPKRRY